MAITPGLEFARAWARPLLASVMTQLAARYEKSGRSLLFTALRDRIGVRNEPGTYAELTATPGISEAVRRINVFKLRKRYRGLLPAAIAETVASPEDLAEASP